jgi:hypothetical protein
VLFVCADPYMKNKSYDVAFEVKQGINMELNGTTYTFVMIKNPKHDPKEPYIYFISDLEGILQKPYL